MGRAKCCRNDKASSKSSNTKKFAFTIPRILEKEFDSFAESGSSSSLKKRDVQGAGLAGLPERRPRPFPFPLQPSLLKRRKSSRDDQIGIGAVANHQRLAITKTKAAKATAMVAVKAKAKAKAVALVAKPKLKKKATRAPQPAKKRKAATTAEAMMKRRSRQKGKATTAHDRLMKKATRSQQDLPVNPNWKVFQDRYGKAQEPYMAAEMRRNMAEINALMREARREKEAAAKAAEEQNAATDPYGEEEDEIDPVEQDLMLFANILDEDLEGMEQVLLDEGQKSKKNKSRPPAPKAKRGGGRGKMELGEGDGKSDSSSAAEQLPPCPPMLLDSPAPDGGHDLGDDDGDGSNSNRNTNNEGANKNNSQSTITNTNSNTTNNEGPAVRRGRYLACGAWDHVLEAWEHAIIDECSKAENGGVGVEFYDPSINGRVTIFIPQGEDMIPGM